MSYSQFDRFSCQNVWSSKDEDVHKGKKCTLCHSFVHPYKLTHSDQSSNNRSYVNGDITCSHYRQTLPSSQHSSSVRSLYGKKSCLKQKQEQVQVSNTASDKLPQSNHVVSHPSSILLPSNLHGKLPLSTSSQYKFRQRKNQDTSLHHRKHRRYFHLPSHLTSDSILNKYPSSNSNKTRKSYLAITTIRCFDCRKIGSNCLSRKKETKRKTRDNSIPFWIKGKSRCKFDFYL